MKCYRCGQKLRKTDRIKIIHRREGGKKRKVFIHKRGCSEHIQKAFYRPVSLYSMRHS